MSAANGEGNEVEIHIGHDFDEIVSAMTKSEMAEQEVLTAALSLTNYSLIQDIFLFLAHEGF
ncbi:hypothetical protein V7S43_010198 [Phytophthora oleae]|uniref:Uncharacterized protein n=1 Tax=Phytophthora oleae TaxID=2107226 RepID=A0ABD3FE80_9STRA